MPKASRESIEVILIYFDLYYKNISVFYYAGQEPARGRFRNTFIIS
jgi:hypothetical protein